MNKSDTATTSINELNELLKNFTPDQTEKFIIQLDQYINELSSYGKELSKLNDSQKKFFYGQLLEMEVNNGGFNQFYFNSAGDYSHEILAYLLEIGANHTAEIVSKANNQFPNGKVPKDRYKRQEVMEKIEEKADEAWEDLDQEFYKYEDNLNLLNLEFIRNHISDFK